MVIIAVNNVTNKKIAFTNNTEAKDKLIKDSEISEVLILGKYDLGYPDTTVTTSTLNASDGLIIDNVKYEKRMLQFNTNFIGTNELQISRARQMLGGVINSQQQTITLEFYRNNQYTSDSELFYLRNVVGKITFASADGQRQTSSQNCTLEFTAYKPLFETPEKSTSFLNYVSGEGKIYPFEYPFEYTFIDGATGTIDNKGDVPTPFRAEFFGVLNASSLISRTVNKEIKLKDGVLIPDTDTLIVDTETRTAEINGDNAFDKLDPDTRFYNLLTGKNELEFLAGTDNPLNKVQLTWVEKYLTI